LSTGRVEIAHDGHGNWFNTTGANPDQPLTGNELTAFTVLPGDRLEWRGSIDITLDGTNLAADLSVNKQSLITADTDRRVAVELKILDSGAVIATLADAPHRVTRSKTLDVIVRISKADDITDPQAAPTTVALDDLALTLTQASNFTPGP
jgi:alternate signal-mediated exported protein